MTATGGGAYPPRIADVACASATVCVAVGSYTVTTPAGDVNRPAAWTWAHGSWTVQALGRPRGLATADGALTAIECPGATRCITVGYYDGKAIYGIVTFG